MIANRIPGGIIGKGTEFFSVMRDDSTELMCSHNSRIYDFISTPKFIKNILMKDMKSKPAVEKAMEGIVGKDEEAKLKQFGICQFGALNFEADIDETGKLSAPEYVPCSLRGTCKFEGNGCCAIMVGEGIFLSKAETEVFKLVRLPDKMIANHLFLSVETVKKHFQNIRRKAGFNNKIEMAIWATQKGII